MLYLLYFSAYYVFQVEFDVLIYIETKSSQLCAAVGIPFYHFLPERNWAKFSFRNRKFYGARWLAPRPTANPDIGYSDIMITIMVIVTITAVIIRIRVRRAILRKTVILRRRRRKTQHSTTAK